MSLDVQKITPKQKLTIAKSLCDYEFIMEHWKDNDEDFQSVFYDFYLKARWAVMSKPENSKPFFDKLQSISGEESLIDIVDSLQKEMEKHNYEFSLCTKLLHTRNDSCPIYDSKVREYLINEENVTMWFKGKGAPRGASQRDNIIHDWENLNSWYNHFFETKRADEWIGWFDLNFPESCKISKVKKIDFIIFATN